jgi:uncharacterized protein
MNILFDLNHPSHVHTFRFVIAELEREGHKCHVTARKKDVTQELLREYGIKFFNTGHTPRTRMLKALMAFVTIVQLVFILVSKRVDLVISLESPYAVISSFLCFRKSLTVADTESAYTIHAIMRLFAKRIAVPDCFQEKLSRKQITFKGYKELAYLHSDLFIPDRSVLDKYGIGKDKPYAVLRFVAFGALHDRGHKGFASENKIWLVNSLISLMDVYISSEGELPRSLENRRLKINPADLHHILAFASLYAGDSTTMAAEAAVLGVPSICLNDNELGYLTDLSQNYELIFKFNASESDQEAAVDKAFELARNPLPALWSEKKAAMMKDKINVTVFLTEYAKRI